MNHGAILLWSVIRTLEEGRSYLCILRISHNQGSKIWSPWGRWVKYSPDKLAHIWCRSDDKARLFRFALFGVVLLLPFSDPGPADLIQGPQNRLLSYSNKPGRTEWLRFSEPCLKFSEPVSSELVARTEWNYLATPKLSLSIFSLVYFLHECWWRLLVHFPSS